MPFLEGIVTLNNWTMIADVGLLPLPEPGSLFDDATLQELFEQARWSLSCLRRQRDGEFGIEAQ